MEIESPKATFAPLPSSSRSATMTTATQRFSPHAGGDSRNQGYLRSCAAARGRRRDRRQTRKGADMADEQRDGIEILTADHREVEARFIELGTLRQPRSGSEDELRKDL